MVLGWVRFFQLEESELVDVGGVLRGDRDVGVWKKSYRLEEEKKKFRKKYIKKRSGRGMLTGQIGKNLYVPSCIPWLSFRFFFLFFIHLFFVRIRCSEYSTNWMIRDYKQQRAKDTTVFPMTFAIHTINFFLFFFNVSQICISFSLVAFIFYSFFCLRNITTFFYVPKT